MTKGFSTAGAISSNHFPAFFCCLLFCVLTAACGVLEFPINDDWSYAWPVKNFLETGKLNFLVGFAPAYPLVISGIILSKMFGFSFALLHFSSAAFAVLTAIGLYFTALELGSSKNEALFILGVFISNPLVVNMAFSYMTELPTMAFIIWFLYYLCRYAKTKKLTDSIMASFLLCLAVSMRQSALIFLPVCLYLCVASLFERKTKKAAIETLILIAIPFICAFFADRCYSQQLIYNRDSLWMKATIGDILHSWLSHPKNFLLDIWQTNSKVLCYLGLFSIPLLILNLRHCLLAAREKRKLFSAVVVFAIVIMSPSIYLLQNSSMMPFFPNIIFPPQLGTYGLHSGLKLWAGNNLVFLTVLSMVAAAFSIITVFAMLDLQFLADWKNGNWKAGPKIIVLISMVFVLLITLLQVTLQPFDRYLLPLFLPFYLLFCNGNKFHKRDWIASLVALLLMAAYSFVGSYDMAKFNQTRWQLIGEIEKLGISSEKIDGGPEYIFWRDPFIYSATDLPGKERWSIKLRGHEPFNNIRWWPVKGDDYMVLPFIPDVYKPIEEKKYWSFWRFGWKTMYSLKRKDS